VACEYLGTSIVGEERRVDVDDPHGKCFQKRGGENQHPASEDDEIRGEGTKHFGQPAIIRFARDRVAVIGQRQRYGGHPSGRGSFERAGTRTIADDDSHLG
jgi:hypothetical protein